jgi:hypothetical protein
MNLYVAAPAEPTVGWGHPMALIITALVFWAFTSAYKRWKQVKNTPSQAPTSGPAQVTATTAKPQVNTGVAVDQGGNRAGTAVVVRPTPAPPAVPDDDALVQYAALRLSRMNTTQIVREMKNAFGISERTAWRVVGRAKKNREGAGQTP